MKRMLFILGVIFFSSVIPFLSYSQSVTINNKWIEHDVVEDGVKGIELHVDFLINGLKGKECKIIVYFEEPKGSGLKDLNGRYCTTGGHVCVSKKFVPTYDNSHYSDFDIFMPVDEIHMKAGSHTYYCDIRILHAGSFLNKSNYLTFTGTTSGQQSNNYYANNQQAAPKRVDRTNLPGGGYQEYIHNADGSMTMKTFSPCPMCHGQKTCQGCFGTGGRFMYGVYYPCTLCAGTNKCHACKGTGGTYSTAVIQNDGTLSGHDTRGSRYTTIDGQVVGIDANGRIITGNESGGNSGSSNNSNGSSGSSDRYGNITCHMCKGSGVCSSCGGDGICDNSYGGTFVCPNCDNGKCRRCKGTGKIHGLKSTEGHGW